MPALNMHRVNWRWGVLLLCAVLFIGACGGSDSAESDSAEVAPTATVAPAIGISPSAATSVPQPTAPQTSSSGGGGNLDLDGALDELIELYEEMLAVLANVTDKSSAEAAVADVTRISNKFKDLDERMGDYSQEEIMAAVISGRLSGFSEELTREMSRIFSDPALFTLLAEAFENFN